MVRNYVHVINQLQGKIIFFVIKLDEEKARIVKICKEKEKLIAFLDNLADSQLIYHFLYSIPIYKGPLCYVSPSKAIKFKSYANQVLNMYNNAYKDTYCWEHKLKFCVLYIKQIK